MRLGIAIAVLCAIVGVLLIVAPAAATLHLGTGDRNAYLYPFGFVCVVAGGALVVAAAVMAFDRFRTRAAIRWTLGSVLSLCVAALFLGLGGIAYPWSRWATRARSRGWVPGSELDVGCVRRRGNRTRRQGGRSPNTE